MNRFRTVSLGLLCSVAFVNCDPAVDPEFREIHDPIQVRVDLITVEYAVREYAIRNDKRYPRSLNLLVMPGDPCFPYIDGNRLPLDPWGNEYVYHPPTEEDPVLRITCYGRDGVPGGEGADADVVNLD